MIYDSQGIGHHLPWQKHHQSSKWQQKSLMHVSTECVTFTIAFDPLLKSYSTKHFGIAIMSSIKDDYQQLINKAVALLIKAPMMTVPQIMHTAKFTIAQSEDHALQMCVCCAFKSKRSNKNTTPANHIGGTVDLASPMPSVSMVTDLSSSTVTATLSATSAGKFVSKPPQETMWMTSLAQVKCVNNKKKLNSHQRVALKQATHYIQNNCRRPRRIVQKSQQKILKKLWKNNLMV